MVSRRNFVKLAAVSASVPLLGQVSLSASAAEKVPANDPAALSLKYVEVASDATRTDKGGVAGADQICGNCRFYANSDTPDWGGCVLFQNRLVAKGGWCVGWVPAT
jgi:hypothetical protein|tara:strand:- start:49 stop:366 length:318 start_codon:yes stop_codon:yes gene_type:complete